MLKRTPSMLLASTAVALLVLAIDAPLAAARHMTGPSVAQRQAQTSASDTFRVGIPSGLDSMNPIAATRSDYLFTAIYPKLCQYSDKLPNIIGDFATKWRISN